MRRASLTLFCFGLSCGCVGRTGFEQRSVDGSTAQEGGDSQGVSNGGDPPRSDTGQECGASSTDCEDAEACTIDTCDAGVCVHALIDVDGDGVPPLSCGGTDCADEDPARYPGAEGPAGDPTCSDGTDNDCDGLIDADDSSCDAPIGVCVTAAWCWENPLPQGTDIHDGWSDSASSVWIAGPYGMLFHWDGTSWTRADLRTGNTLNGVFALSGTDVWTVGQGVWHWDGVSYDSHVVSLGFQVEISDVWGAAADNVWAVVTDGRVVRYDGTGWSDFYVGNTRRLEDIWGASATAIWAVGWTGTVLRFDGESWAAQNSGTNRHLYGIAGLSATEVWAVGAQGTLLAYNGSTWSSIATGTNAELVAAFASGPGQVEVAGSGGTVLSCTTSGCSTVISDTTEDLLAIWGTGRSDIWAGGLAGTLIQWDASQRTNNDVATTGTLRGIWASAPDNAWAVGGVWGGTGEIVHWDGSAWTAVATVTGWLYDIWAASSTDIWAVGGMGTIAHWDGTDWAEVSSGVTTSLNGIGGSGPGDIWAVGIGGIVLRWNGTAWLPHVQTVSADWLRDVYAASATDVWVTGDPGLLLHWNGNQWSQVPSGTTYDLLRIDGTGMNDIWVVGGEINNGGIGGVVLHYDGVQWSRRDTALPSDLYGLWATNGGAWVSGADGEIFFIDTSLQPLRQQIDVGAWLFGVGGVGTDLWVVGSGGLILRQR